MRKIIQVFFPFVPSKMNADCTVSETITMALADDGSFWILQNDESGKPSHWTRADLCDLPFQG